MLSPSVLLPLKLLAILGCALSAGIYFAFSSFVMRALAQLPPPQGIAAMQAINITVINPLFMGVFMGTAVVSVWLAIAALLKWHSPSAVYVLLGCLLYLIGTFGVTIIGNVPLNYSLDAVKPDTPEAATLWTRYLSQWTLWNHVRTVAALIATGAFAWALRFPK
ncbi:MAG: DUF1772 domain-containing protein [Elainellaceae cyanobacterium]